MTSKELRLLELRIEQLTVAVRNGLDKYNHGLKYMLEDAERRAREIKEGVK